MDKLRDIKPLLEIPDYSYYLFMGGVIFVGMVLLGLLWWVIKKGWSNRGLNQRQRDFEALKNVDWQDSKKAAYQVTFLGRKLCEDERSKEIFAQILPMLEPYKYKKEVPSVSTETLRQYNLLVHLIDESL